MPELKNASSSHTRRIWRFAAHKTSFFFCSRLSSIVTLLFCSLTFENYLQKIFNLKISDHLANLSKYFLSCAFVIHFNLLMICLVLVLLLMNFGLFLDLNSIKSQNQRSHTGIKPKDQTQRPQGPTLETKSMDCRDQTHDSKKGLNL